MHYNLKYKCLTKDLRLMTKSDIANIKLADAGCKRIEWAGFRMPVLNTIAQRFSKEKPFKDLKIGACLHVTSETANLMITLKKEWKAEFIKR